MRPRPFTLIHEAVLHFAATSPERPAIDEGPRTITYSELAELMLRIGAALRARGSAHGDRIGILLGNGIEGTAALLGALCADGCYVPLGPSLPARRLASILSDAGVEIILTISAHLPLLEMLRPELGDRMPQALLLDSEEISGATAMRPEFRGGGEDLAYLMYTSGTTGEPKGVMVRHRNVSAFLKWALPTFGFGPEDRFSNHSRLGFDLSVFDLFCAFHSGATVCPILSPPDLMMPAEFIERSGVTVWFSVPSVLGFLIRTGQLAGLAGRHRLRVAAFCGEALLAGHARELMEKLPGVAVCNLYGPTEATIACSFTRLGKAPEHEGAVGIGRATPGTGLHVFELENDRPAAPGATGRLMISGAQLAAGYWRRPELTRERFRTDPWADPSGGLIYDSGDLAKLDAQGELHWIGRSDSQVKIRGFRVELGEIESALASSPAVHEAAVSFRPGSDPALVAAISLKPGIARSDDLTDLIARHCRTLLPEYMVPELLRILEALPRTPNGKIDRKKLFDQAEGPFA